MGKVRTELGSCLARMVPSVRSAHRSAKEFSLQFANYFGVCFAHSAVLGTVSTELRYKDRASRALVGPGVCKAHSEVSDQ